MEKSTAQLTVQYIQEHPNIRSCLKKGLLNYSSLARLIAKELGISKKTSKEAILIAARRFYEKLQKEQSHEKKMLDLLASTELEVKTKIAVFILTKKVDFTLLHTIEKRIKDEQRVFYLVEGSDSYILLVQEIDSAQILKSFSSLIRKHHSKLALINIKSTEAVEKTPGVLAYLASLFSEHGVNIVESISCWKDDIFVVKEKDLAKTLQFLSF